MQTFVPYEDHIDSAAFLDNKRLFKQLVEDKQILIALSDPQYGWRAHPAVIMWTGHERFLASYIMTLAEMWRARGCLRESGGPYKESISLWLGEIYPDLDLDCEEPPEWWGGPIHATHRLKLFWKQPSWYGPKLYGPVWRKYLLDEEPSYFWPRSDSAKLESLNASRSNHGVDGASEERR